MKKNRVIEYDIMRIIACFCVIMIHVAVFDQMNNYEYTSFQFQAFNIWGVLSRWAVPAFVMLSGMMVIKNADNVSIKQLFIHRVLRMIVVYIIWSMIYSGYNVYVLGVIYATSPFKTFVDGCFSGEIHMWYLLVIAGLYIISPVLSVLVKYLDSRWIRYWLLSMFIFSSIIPFIIKLDIKFISVIVNSMNGYMDIQFLGGWTLYFVLGYYIQQHDFSINERNGIYLLSCISILYTLYGTVIYYMNHGHALGILPYELPNIVVYSVGVVIFFKYEVARYKISLKLKNLIVRISKLTFGIYLIHVLVLKVLYSVGINVAMCNTMISIPIIALICFVTSAVVIGVIRKIPIIGTYIA